MFLLRLVFGVFFLGVKVGVLLFLTLMSSDYVNAKWSQIESSFGSINLSAITSTINSQLDSTGIGKSATSIGLQASQALSSNGIQIDLKKVGLVK